MPLLPPGFTKYVPAGTTMQGPEPIEHKGSLKPTGEGVAQAVSAGRGAVDKVLSNRALRLERWHANHFPSNLFEMMTRNHLGIPRVVQEVQRTEGVDPRSRKA